MLDTQQPVRTKHEARIAQLLTADEPYRIALWNLYAQTKRRHFSIDDLEAFRREARLVDTYFYRLVRLLQGLRWLKVTLETDKSRSWLRKNLTAADFGL